MTKEQDQLKKIEGKTKKKPGKELGRDDLEENLKYTQPRLDKMEYVIEELDEKMLERDLKWVYESEIF